MTQALNEHMNNKIKNKKKKSGRGGKFKYDMLDTV
jgi:hypothetical protein